MAEIVGVHGVKGMLTLKIFSAAPGALLDYMPLCDAAGLRTFDFLTFQPHKNVYLATLDGVSDRTAAEKLRGVKLYMPRERLPKIKAKDAYYYTDLVGLTAKNPEGGVIGKIVQAANFGAGDLLEIKPLKGASYFLPFTRSIVPDVNVEKREATVIVPPGLLD